MTGSAPIAAEVVDFLKIAFSWEVFEGYGQTELWAASHITYGGDTTRGHVGGVVGSYEMKLVDVPEMDYYATDVDENGNLQPRGEVCLRGTPGFVGYFKNLEKTLDTIDSEGWIHTGDIGTILYNGALKIIDRKKNIFKLALGEYIAAEKLELLFVKSPLIKQIFIYGDSLQSYLVSIIIPDPHEVSKYAIQNSLQILDYQSFINSSHFHQAIKDSLEVIAESAHLNSFEIPQKVHCSSIEFSIEQGTLTPTFVIVRSEAKKVYLEDIRAMYDGAILQGEQ